MTRRDLRSTSPVVAAANRLIGTLVGMSVADLLLAGDTAAFHATVDDADPSDVAAVLALAGHEDSEVRRAIASALPLLTRRRCDRRCTA